MGVKTFARSSDPDLHSDLGSLGRERGERVKLKREAGNGFPTRKADAMANAETR